MDHPCLPTRRLIAQGPLCGVEECTCGVLHVTLGSLTIRLQPEVVESIAVTLGEALRKIAARDLDEHRSNDTVFPSVRRPEGLPS